MEHMHRCKDSSKPFYTLDKRYNDSTKTFWFLVDVNNRNLAKWISNKPRNWWIMVGADDYNMRYSISEELYTLLDDTWS